MRVLSFAVIVLLLLFIGCIGTGTDTKTAPTATPALTTTAPPVTAPPSAVEPSVKFKGRYIDVHTHIMPTRMPLEQIIKNMDSEGIDKMVIMQVPINIYKMEPQSKYGIPDAAEKYPDRFVALYEGEAIFMFDSVVERGSYTKSEEEKYIALLEEAMRSGKYRGFGEIALLHFPPPDKAGDSPIKVPCDHPWMLILSDVAAKYDVPIDIHMEATDETIAGLEKLLDHNKKTKIIWSHAGWSNTGKSTPQLMRRLMEKHPNLYSSIKIRKADTPEIVAVRILDDNNNIMPEWMALFKDFPERFVIGSDIKPGAREDEFKHVKGHRTVLEQLPPEILKKIERENAEEIFKIKS